VKYKTIIFDFDGTLADSLSVIINVVKQLAMGFKQEHLLKVPFKELRSKTIKQLIKEFQIPFYRLPFLINRGRRLMTNEIAEVKLFTDISLLIKQLKKKHFKLGILSSNSKKNIIKVLKKNNLDKEFEFIHSEMNIFGKDKALMNIFKKHNLRKEEVLYVGDEVRDIEACKKIDVKIVAVTWGFNTKETLKIYQPDYLIDRPKDLLNLVKSS